MGIGGTGVKQRAPAWKFWHIAHTRTCCHAPSPCPHNHHHPAIRPPALQTFLQPELLDESDSWYCPGACKAHVRADKKLDLWALPEVLVVHLVRFSNSR